MSDDLEVCFLDKFQRSVIKCLKMSQVPCRWHSKYAICAPSCISYLLQSKHIASLLLSVSAIPYNQLLTCFFSYIAALSHHRFVLEESEAELINTSLQIIIWRIYCTVLLKHTPHRMFSLFMMFNNTESLRL